jgi:hypothetical protein
MHVQPLTIELQATYELIPVMHALSSLAMAGLSVLIGLPLLITLPTGRTVGWTFG